MADDITQDAIDAIAKHINERNNKNYSISVVTISGNYESPQYFEIIPFMEIDNTNVGFYAVDGSYNSQPFYNGLAIGIYRAGYVSFRSGKQVRMNSNNDPVILGQSYTPKNILVTQEEHKEAIYEELFTLLPVKNFLDFLEIKPNNLSGYQKSAIFAGGMSTLLSFCQEILEWSLVYEIACRPEIQSGDFILRDGSLRSLNIRQEHLVKLGKFLAQDKQLFLIGITKNSPIKMELNYTFRHIDNYLQDKLKHTYPFRTPNNHQRKLCCWFQVSNPVLLSSYGDGSMFAKQALRGGRGIGVFHVARLDYVEKLQNYDWVVADLNIFNVIPLIEYEQLQRSSTDLLTQVFEHLTRLTQEHYILGYPYPLLEAHNFVTLKNDFKELIINRVKQSMYESQGMDHVDIENLFVDIHTRF